MSEFNTKISTASLIMPNNTNISVSIKSNAIAPTKNLKSTQNHNKPQYKSAEITSIIPNNKITEQNSDTKKDFFSNIRTALKEQTQLITTLSNNLEEILRKSPIDKSAVKIAYAKIILLQNNLNATLSNIYKDNKINQAICISILDKEMQKFEDLTSSIINKCNNFIDTENQTDYDENKVIIELDKDIKSHEQPIHNLLNKLDLHNKELPNEAKEFAEYTQFLLQNPPDIHISKNASSEEKIEYTKIKLEYALQLKDVYEGLSKLADLSSKNSNPNEFNHQVQQIYQNILLENKARSNLHIIHNQSVEMKNIEISSPQYKKYLSQAILHNINIKKSYNIRYNMHFWQQRDRQSCVFASICNAKQFSNIDELNNYFSTHFHAKTLETWLIELLDNKIGVSLANGLTADYLNNSDKGLKLNDTNIIGMYKHDEINNSHSGHVISIKKQDNNLYLMDSGANSIQKFDDYNTMMSSLNKQYGSRFNIGNNDDKYSTILFKV